MATTPIQSSIQRDSNRNNHHSHSPFPNSSSSIKTSGSISRADGKQMSSHRQMLLSSTTSHVGSASPIQSRFDAANTPVKRELFALNDDINNINQQQQQQQQQTTTVATTYKSISSSVTKEIHHQNNLGVSHTSISNDDIKPANSLSLKLYLFSFALISFTTLGGYAVKYFSTSNESFINGFESQVEPVQTSDDPRRSLSLFGTIFETLIPTSSPTSAGTIGGSTLDGRTPIGPNGEYLSSSDLKAWWSLYDALGGVSWFKCSASRSNPCECNAADSQNSKKQVICTVIAGEMRITSISLPNNNLRGKFSPSLLQSFTALSGKIDFSSSIGSLSPNYLTLANPDWACAWIPECNDGTYTGGCQFIRSGISACVTVTCTTDGGYAPYGSKCVSPFSIEGQGQYYGCLDIDQYPVYTNPNDPPKNPSKGGNPRKWCPTTDNYSVGFGKNGATVRRNWGYCECVMYNPPTELSTRSPTAQPTNPTSVPTTGAPTRPTDPPVIIGEQTSYPTNYPTKSPSFGTSPFRLNAGDLEGWQVFYDSLGGAQWFSCSSRDDPCSLESIPGCSTSIKRVRCEVINGDLRMTKIILRNNRVRGFIPSMTYTAFGKLTMLNELNLSNDVQNSDNRNSFKNSPCVDLPVCALTGVKCDLRYADLGNADAICATQPPTSPNLTPDDLVAWQLFYDSLGGIQWFQCSNSRANPCSSCKGTDRYITCEVDSQGVNRLTKIVLHNNGLKGTVPSNAINELDGLKVFDIANIAITTGGISNSVQAEGGFQCINFVRCYTPALTCLFSGTALEGYIRCPPTQSPTLPTRSPTKTPITKRPTKVPTTGTPSQLPSALPTNAPTKKPSRFPTKAPTRTPSKDPTLSPTQEPTTRSPTRFPTFDPTTSQPTAKPSTAFPTNMPTDSPTHRPTSKSPTLAPTTLFPTNTPTTTPTTSSPTTRTPTTRSPTTVSPTTEAPTTRSPTFKPTTGTPSNTAFPTQKTSSVDEYNLSPTSTPTRRPGATSTPSIAPTLTQLTKTPSGSPTRTKLVAEDQAAWEALYDALGGASWLSCNSRNNPCYMKTVDGICGDSTAFHDVQCGYFESGLHIVKIQLRNNNMKGTIPIVALANGLTKLELFDLSNTNSLTGRNSLSSGSAGCLLLPQCSIGNKVSCNTSNSGTNLCPTITTPAPTSSILHPDDLKAWQRFYDYLHELSGNKWLVCEDGRNDPCNACPAPLSDSFSYNGVTCEKVFLSNGTLTQTLHITRIFLKENNLKGELSPASISSLTKLRVVDVSNSDSSQSNYKNVFNNNACAQIPRCDINIKCNVANTNIALCSSGGTQRPSASGTRSPVTASSGLFFRDLAAWKIIYSALNGDQWSRCNQGPNDPCGSSCFDTVACGLGFDDDGLPVTRILAINLNNIRANGWIPDTTLSKLSALISLDLSFGGTPFQDWNIYYNTLCLKIDLCSKNYMTCTLPNPSTGIKLCSQSTLSPTQSPTPSVTIVEGPTIPSVAPTSTRRPTTLSTSSPTTNSPTTKPTDPQTLKKSDLAAWQAIWQGLGGSTQWISCGGSQMFTDPCGTAATLSNCNTINRQVTCSVVNGELRIVEIRMQDNKLTGWFPSEAFATLTELSLLDVSNTNSLTTDNNVLTNTQCIDIKRCYSPDMACLFKNSGVSLCPEGSSPTPPSRSPTKAPTLVVLQSDLVAWQALYDSLDGVNWNYCNSQAMYNNPCSECMNGSAYKVKCDVINGVARITEISLPDNNMAGWLSDQILRALTALTSINLDKNKFTNTVCVNLPECKQSLQCSFASAGISICTVSPTLKPSTQSPSKNPTRTDSPTTQKPTTASPTQAPATPKPTTVSPTTVSPTWAPSAAPTLAPTSSPTIAPTTGTPTTQSPTTLAPTTSSPTTRSPTTQSPTFGSPTQTPTTQSPTIPAPTTKSPTTQKPTSAAPTKAPIAATDINDLNGWQGLMNSLNSASWENCNSNEIYQDPCIAGCNINQNIYVKCEEVNGVSRIIEIKLQNNNLFGWFLEEALLSMSAIEKFDISNVGETSKNILTNVNSCLNLPQCITSVQCNFSNTGKDYCKANSLTNKG